MYGSYVGFTVFEFKDKFLNVNGIHKQNIMKNTIVLHAVTAKYLRKTPQRSA